MSYARNMCVKQYLLGQIQIGIILQLILLEGLLVSTSAVSCNENENQFQKYPSGACPTGTQWDAATQCCTGCPVCGPGYKKGPGCKGPCQPCPVNFYSDQYDNTECFPCTTCSDLKRTFKSQCYPTRDTSCGQCLTGFWEHPDLLKEPLRMRVRCLGCPQVLPSGDETGEACALSREDRESENAHLTLTFGNLKLQPNEHLMRKVKRILRRNLELRDVPINRVTRVDSRSIKVQFDSEDDIRKILEKNTTLKRLSITRED